MPSTCISGRCGFERNGPARIQRPRCHRWETSPGPTPAGDVTRAIEFQHRADAVLEMELALNLAIGSERQKLAFADTVSQRTDRTISLNLAAPLDPGMRSLAALVVLQRKGRVLDAMTDTLGRLRERAVSPERSRPARSAESDDDAAGAPGAERRRRHVARGSSEGDQGSRGGEGEGRSGHQRSPRRVSRAGEAGDDGHRARHDARRGGAR